MYNIIKQKLASEGSKCNITAIFKTGSQLFRNNPQDMDIIVVVENYEKDYGRFVWTEKDVRYDVFVKDITQIEKLLEFNLDNSPENEWKSWLYNYFYSLEKDFIYGSLDIKWPILEYKDQYMTYMRAEYASSIGKRINRTRGLKRWVHYYAILKIYENNNPTITEEMGIDILKLYSDSPESIDIIEWVELQLNEKTI